MYLFDNKNLELIEVKGHLIEIDYCDSRGLITAPLEETPAKILRFKLFDSGVSASSIDAENGRTRLRIPWTFTDTTKTTLCFTGARNAKAGTFCA